MEIILLERVHNLGNIGDKVRVKSGYGRNYLIPHGKAVFATQENLIKFEARRAELEKIAADAFANAQKRAESLSNLTVTLKAKAGEEGKLFGSIGTRDIANVIKEAGHDVAKSEIQLPEGPIRQIGQYAIQLQLGSDVDVTIKLDVVSEE